ncbi:MAG: hypothetical protein AB1551_07185 [Actinomycetota bacterium]
MDENQLERVAMILNDAYFATWAYSLSFRDEHHNYPPTHMAKVHHLRSIVQVALAEHEQYDLAEDFVQFGRVQFFDRQTGRSYLLRSHAANAIEQVVLQRSLFDANQYLKSDVVMIVYRFHRGGLDLSVVGTRHSRGRTHLESSGRPTFIATWSYATAEGKPFDQEAHGNPFEELGDLGKEEEEEGGSEG